MIGPRLIVLYYSLLVIVAVVNATISADDINTENSESGFSVDCCPNYVTLIYVYYYSI